MLRISGRGARSVVDAIVLVGALINGGVGALSLFAPSLFLAAVGLAGQTVTPASAVFGDYAGARELALGVGLLGFRVSGRYGGLCGVLVVAGVANAIDAGGSVVAQRWEQLPGAVLFTVAYLIAAIFLEKRFDLRSLGAAASVSSRSTSLSVAMRRQMRAILRSMAPRWLRRSARAD